VAAVYTAFAVTQLLGGFLQVGVFWDGFEEKALASGMSQAYLDAYQSFYTNPAIMAGMTAFIVAASITGCILGYSLLKKYFIKAGLVD
jgi:energy-coupling factor transport system substrate-specific component